MKRGTPEHPKTKRLIRLLKIPSYAAVGILESLFHFAAKYSPSGDVGRFSDEDISESIGWTESPQELIAALVSSGWLDEHPECRLVVHDWKEHAEESVKKSLKRWGKSFVEPSETVESVRTFSGQVQTTAETVQTCPVRHSHCHSHCQSQGGIYEDVSQEGESESPPPNSSLTIHGKPPSVTSQQLSGAKPPNTQAKNENGSQAILGRVSDVSEIGDTTDGDRLAVDHAKWRRRIDPRWKGEKEFAQRYGPVYQVLIDRGELEAEQVQAALEYAEKREFWATKFLTPESMLRKRDGVTWLEACLAEASVQAKSPARNSPPVRSRDYGRPKDLVLPKGYSLEVHDV